MIKEVWLTLGAIFWGISITLGQNEFATIQLPGRAINNYWIVPDDEGNICIQYYKKPYLYFHLVDQSGNELKEIKEPFRYSPEVFGGSFSDGKYQFYYTPRSKKKEGDVGAFIVNQTAQEFEKQVRNDVRATKTEEFIGQFSDHTGFYLLISVRGSHLMRIARLDGSDKPEVKNFTAPTLIEKAFSPQQPLLFVNQLSPKSIFSFQATRKVFFNEGNFYFTFDHPEQFKTYIWEIDWEEGTSELKNIPAAKLVFGRSSNSYLHNDHLYRLTVDQVKVDLSVYNIHSGDSIANYSHSGETKIPFQSGPIHFIDEYGTQNRIQNFKNDKLFKTLSNGNPSIFVEQVNNNNVKVTWGAFNAVATGLSIGGGLGSFGRVGGIAIGGSQQLTGTRRGSTFIHSYLGYPDLKLSEDTDLLTPNERIFRYLDKNRKSQTFVSTKVYSYDEDRLHLTYIDNSEAKLRIVEFSR